MGRSGRTLEVTYDDAEVFRREYESNLSNGGVFIETDPSFELRDPVGVRLVLAPAAGMSITLEGEVVHIVGPEMAEMGGTPGVAVQFREPAHEVCDRLAPLLVAMGLDPKARLNEPHGRKAPRKSARVAARIDAGSECVSGQTRNLSRGGVLVGVQGQELPVGAPVRVALRHPTTHEELEVDARVVRQVESNGAVSAIAVEFEPGADETEQVERFVDDVQSIEHARRLGGITGPIAELGPQSIVQMFATTAPKGTILLRRGQEEGTICFEGGLLLLVKVGNAAGMKALVRMLGWRDGSFEFHARIDDRDISDPPFPLEAAIFDAVRQLDESERIDRGRFPLQAHLTVCDGAAPGASGGLSKVEEALIDLAGAGFTIQRALEVIPEPDPEIFRALQSLVDEKLLELA